MDMNGLTQLVGSLGFPIVCCIVLFKHLEKERESHEHETQTLTQALNENTKIITELKTFMEVITRKMEDHDYDG